MFKNEQKVFGNIMRKIKRKNNNCLYNFEINEKKFVK